MAYDHAATRRLRAKVVHDTLAIAATYFDDSLAAPVELRVRWHNKQTLRGDLDSQGYSQFIDSIDRVVFSPSELIEKGIEVVRGALVTITALGFDNAKLHIDTRDETAGPGEEIWLVGKG